MTKKIEGTDIVQTELRKGFEWTTRHSTATGIVVFILLLCGGGWAAWNSVNESKETAVQEKFYEAEKAYLEKKEAFDSVGKPDPKNPTAKPEGKKATGDLNQDYGPEVANLEEIVTENAGTKGAALAALTLSNLYSEYGKKDEAIAVLKKAQKTSGTLGALLQSELGVMMADAGDCKNAVDLWNGLLKNSAAGFMASQLKLKMGLCYESMGQKAQAEDFYKQVASADKESSTAKSAERFLRLMKVAK